MGIHGGIDKNDSAVNAVVKVLDSFGVKTPHNGLLAREIIKALQSQQQTRLNSMPHHSYELNQAGHDSSIEEDD